MGSSKVILVGAISVVFGLYSLSLYRVNGYVGNTAEVASYITRASDNAKAGVQWILNIWSRGNDLGAYTNVTNLPKTGTFNLIDPAPAVDMFIDTVYVLPYPLSPILPWTYWDGKTYTLKIVSHGYYRAPSEPAAFQGHEVIMTANVLFYNTPYGGISYPWYRLTVTSVYSTINYAAEKQLESLQGYESNLIGY